MVNIDMNGEQNRKKFCPKCGGVLENGVCNCCHYKMILQTNPEDIKEPVFNRQAWERMVLNPNIQPNQGVTYKNYAKSKKKSGLKIFALIMGSMCFLAICILCGILFVHNLMKNVHISVNEFEIGQAQPQIPEEGDSQIIPYVEPVPRDDDEEPHDPNQEFGQTPSNENEYWSSFLQEKGEADNPFLANDYVSHMGTNHKNYRRDEFQGQYYEKICDSIDRNVTYKIERKYYSYVSKEYNTQMHFSCVYLQGDLPNIDIINKTIYDKTLFLARAYLENYASYISKEGVDICVDSYITYNDDTQISIVLDEKYKLENTTNIDLYCININLESGILFNNGNMLALDNVFAKEFLEKSKEQNGDNTALNQMDEQSVLNRLQNEYQNIVFFTPIGMELGINYEENGSTGWVTVTYTDYQQYLYHL